jgi:release factor glutamine methyltransferase
VAYLVGQKEFYSLRFKVTPATLIPRPETEHLIVAALEVCKGYEKPIRIIDVGTGSGCIAVTMATQLDKNYVVAATDISLEALAVARENAEAHGVDAQIRFYEGDLLDALPEGSKPVHLIVSNPPYIGRCEVDTVEATVKDFEPDAALFAGEQGTEVIERLIPQAEKMLLPGGHLIFEASPAVMDRCEEMVKQSTLEFVEVINDYAGLKRILVAKQKA